MTQRLEVSKLAQLRAKTDRQLVQVIGSSIEAGLHLVRRTGGIVQAEQALEQADRLLQLVGGKDRRALEPKLARLAEEIRDRAGVRVRAAS